MFLFINKAWGYGDPQPDHYFLALNYRISELHAAVALAQLDKLPSVVERRIAAADTLTRMITGLPGIQAPAAGKNDVHVYWKYCLNVDKNKIRDGALGLAKALKEYGIASAPRYIQKPAFMCEVFQKRRTFGNSEWPFSLARTEAVDYSKSRFPMTFKALDDVLVLPWNERYTQEHLDFIGNAIQESVQDLSL
jgi:dTDP-4-amino-4,6-dideoxygalactose transaminase